MEENRREEKKKCKKKRLEENLKYSGKMSATDKGKQNATGSVFTRTAQRRKGWEASDTSSEQGAIEMNLDCQLFDCTTFLLQIEEK